MTKKQIEREVGRWQELLSLRDWKIEVVCIEADQINDDGDQANVRRRLYTRRATITIAHKRNAEELTKSIVHELLHLVLAEVDNVFEETRNRLTEPAWTLADHLYNDCLERAIDCTAGALVTLDKKTGGD